VQQEVVTRRVIAEADGMRRLPEEAFSAAASPVSSASRAWARFASTSVLRHNAENKGGSAMLELYHALTSTCSQKVRLCLAEKRLEWVDRRLNLAANDQLAPDYLALNPNGVVPTLVHDGQAIVDSSVICEYLDEVFPQQRLTPDDAVARAHMRAWMRFLEEVPTVAIRVPSFHQVLARRFETLDAERFNAEVADARPLRKNFYRRMGPHGFNAEEVRVSLDELSRTLDRMEHALANGPWLLGDAYTLADIVVTPTIDRMADLGLSSLWARHPRVSDWYRRIQARPAFAAAYPPGTRLSEVAAVRPLEERMMAEAGALQGRE
jgi:glutathione S-transferase